jgi:four helix bundle suffix protein
MELIKTRSPETIANISICMIKQNDYLMFKLLQSLEREFLKTGGFRERLTAMRLNERKRK